METKKENDYLLNKYFKDIDLNLFFNDIDLELKQEDIEFTFNFDIDI
jgi:hypothetical protein